MIAIYQVCVWTYMWKKNDVIKRDQGILMPWKIKQAYVIKNISYSTQLSFILPINVEMQTSVTF